MKIRQGFVSNSSSASFVVYGYLLDENDPMIRDGASDLSSEDLNNTNIFDLIKIIQRKNIYVLYGEEDDIPKGKILIGDMLLCIHSNEDSFTEIKLDDIVQKEMQRIADVFGITEKPRLFGGTMMC